MKPEIIYSTMRRMFCHKDLQKLSVKRCLIISLYVAACYYALTGADTYTFRKAYKTLTEKPARLNALVERTFVEREELNEGTENRDTILKCGLLKVSSRMPVLSLIVLPGLLVFFLVLVFSLYVVNPSKRGFYVLSTFTSICILVGSLHNHFLGVGWLPSITVLLKFVLWRFVLVYC